MVDICCPMSMLIAGFPGGALSCADAAGPDDSAQATIAAARLGVFILEVPGGLNGLMLR
jgi:hypothetical protein